jgi:hypothetical protein
MVFFANRKKLPLLLYPWNLQKANYEKKMVAGEKGPA